MRRRFFRHPLIAFVNVSWLVLLMSSLMLVFGARGFCVYGSCMEPNLRTGERVLASPLAYWLKPPHRGDVVIFKYPCDPSKNYVKRIIGLPGDIIEIRNGRLLLDGRPAAEPYKQLASHGDYGPAVVHPGNLFVLGDNRDQSNDSRYWGQLPMANLEARALLLYWPLSRAHVIN